MRDGSAGGSETSQLLVGSRPRGVARALAGCRFGSAVNTSRSSTFRRGPGPTRAGCLFTAPAWTGLYSRSPHPDMGVQAVGAAGGLQLVGASALPWRKHRRRAIHRVRRPTGSRSRECSRQAGRCLSRPTFQTRLIGNAVVPSPGDDRRSIHANRGSPRAASPPSPTGPISAPRWLVSPHESTVHVCV